MAKGVKTGGRQKEGNEARDKLIRVSSEYKPDVERFRNLLDDPNIAEIALNALADLEAIAKQSGATYK